MESIGSSANVAPGTWTKPSEDTEGSSDVSRETSGTTVSSAGDAAESPAAAAEPASDGAEGADGVFGVAFRVPALLAAFTARLASVESAVRLPDSRVSPSAAGDLVSASVATASASMAARTEAFGPVEERVVALLAGARRASLLIPAPRRGPVPPAAVRASSAAAKNRSTGRPAGAVSWFDATDSSGSALLGIKAPSPRPKPRRFSAMGKSFPYAHYKRHGLIV